MKKKHWIIGGIVIVGIVVFFNPVNGAGWKYLGKNNKNNIHDEK